MNWITQATDRLACRQGSIRQLLRKEMEDEQIGYELITKYQFPIPVAAIVIDYSVTHLYIRSYDWHQPATMEWREYLLQGKK